MNPPPRKRARPVKSPIDEIIHLFETHGANAYHGEDVSQREHALQAALMAEREGADSELISAALLHDIGHLLYEGEEHAAVRGIDDRHEFFGAAWLEKHFGPAVTEPIRLHVDAKRYLCTAEPGYFDRLSPSSVRSLELQGGPLESDELERFRDEAAKVAGLETPTVEDFRQHLLRALRVN